MGMNNCISVYGIWSELQGIEVTYIECLSYKEFYGTSFALKLVGICNSIKNQNKVTENKVVTNKLKLLRNDIVHCTSQKQWSKTCQKIINILKYIKNINRESINFDDTTFDISKLLKNKLEGFTECIEENESEKVDKKELVEDLLWN